MTLEEALKEGMCAGDPDEDARVPTYTALALHALRDLAVDGVLVVDFRTDQAGEVLLAEQVAVATFVDDREAHYEIVGPDGVPDDGDYPLFRLVRPNDESDVKLVEHDLPGMWEYADFEGGLDVVRGPDWVRPNDGSTQ